MRLAVIGAGHIGSTIGRAWLSAGHDVSFGVTSPDKYGELSAAGAKVSAPAGATESADAVVIDATNNVGGHGPLNSRGAVAEVAPGASYYRAFNTLGWESFATPTFAGGERADLFYAGPDGPSRDLVEQLVADVGL